MWVLVGWCVCGRGEEDSKRDGKSNLERERRRTRRGGEGKVVVGGVDRERDTGSQGGRE